MESAVTTSIVRCGIQFTLTAIFLSIDFASFNTFKNANNALIFL